MIKKLARYILRDEFRQIDLEWHKAMASAVDKAHQRGFKAGSRIENHHRRNARRVAYDVIKILRDKEF